MTQNDTTSERYQPRSDISRRTYLWSMVIILLLATALRVYALEADLPLHVSLSQGPTTDGAHTVAAGRNMVLFGDWNPFGDPRNPLYLHPGMSWLSLVVFQFLGMGYWQANLIAVVTGLLTIVFIAAFAREQFSRRAALLSAAIMTTNYLFLMYNRTPMAYTPLTCGLAMALYFWQRGLRHTGWFLVSGLITGLSILFIKIPGLSFLPVAFGGLALLAWRQRKRHGRVDPGPALLYVLGLLVSGWAWYYLVRRPSLDLLGTHLGRAINTFEPSLGLEENLRFALQSVLQFGIRSSFFLQILPLFVLAYLYTFFRALQLTTRDRQPVPLGEVLALLYLVGVAVLLLGTSYRPTRYLIMLIPPMSLVASLAIDRWLSLRQLRWPNRFRRWLPALLLLGITYFYYQVLAALSSGLRLIRFRTGVADFRIIASGDTLFQVLILALVIGTITTFVFLRQALQHRGQSLKLPTAQARLWIALGFVASGLILDTCQYVAWARAPEYSIAEASRQIELDLGSHIVLGGPYAYVLALENTLPAVRFYPYQPYESIVDLPFTHVLAEADSMLANGPFNDERLHQNHPDLMQRAHLVKTYVLRGYLVKVYEIVQ